MTCIIKNTLAPHFHKMLVEMLKDSFFSMIIDETTDVSTCKQLAIITRVYNNETKTVQCNLYELIELTHGDAETLFGAICNAFEKDSIPLSYIIGFAADTIQM